MLETIIIPNRMFCINLIIKIFVEKFQPRNFGDQEDAWFVDSGLSYDSSPASTFSGLDHLEGEEVAIWGDGQVLTSQIVSGGEITLASGTASRVIIGLPFTYKFKPVRMDVNFPNGISLGSIKKISEIIKSSIVSKDSTVVKVAPSPSRA